MILYPVNLDISSRLCLVVGGGAVAARKIESLLLSQAIVRIVSPGACGKIRALAEAGKVEWLKRRYRDTDIKGAFLVFAATNNKSVQGRIALQAKKEGALLNSADSPAQCDFQVPAKLRRGELLIAVSTGGSSPALSALIKRHLGREFGPEYAILVKLLAKIRCHIVDNAIESDKNRRLFHKVLALPILELIRDGQWADLQKQLSSVLPTDIDSRLLVADLRGKVE